MKRKDVAVIIGTCLGALGPSLAQAMTRTSRWEIKAKEPAPDHQLIKARMDQAEAKRARKAQIRRGGK